MGRTLPSATQVFQIEEHSLQRFRRALRRTDQRAFDDLFDFAHRHIAEAGYAAHAFPIEIYLLSMLLEEHKQVLALRSQVEQIKNLLGNSGDAPPPGRLL